MTSPVYLRWTESYQKFPEGMVSEMEKGAGGGMLCCLVPLPSFPQSVARMLGSATKVRGQKRLRLLYIFCGHTQLQDLFISGECFVGHTYKVFRLF
jgi:hypothetical protein